MTGTYKIAAIVVAAVAVGLGAFYAGRQTAPAATSARTTTTTTTASAGRGAASATTTTLPASATTTTVATAATTLCQEDQLRVAQSGAGGAAGTIERTFSLVNSSAAACSLYGYPGMALLGPGGAAEPTVVARGGGLSFENVAPSTVALAPGATAYFNVGFSDVTPPCSSATSVEVTPPTNTTPAVVTMTSQPMTVCNNGTLHVSAIFGATNSAATQTTAPS